MYHNFFVFNSLYILDCPLLYKYTCYCYYPIFCPMVLVFCFSSDFYVLLAFSVFFVCIGLPRVAFSKCNYLLWVIVLSPCLLHVYLPSAIVIAFPKCLPVCSKYVCLS